MLPLSRRATAPWRGLVAGCSIGLALTANAVQLPFEMPAKPVAPAAAGTVPPRPWSEPAFSPVTDERIRSLPTEEQKAWRQYWKESVRRTELMPPRRTAARTPSKPLEGAPIPALYSTPLRTDATDDYYRSAEARRTAAHVVSWQSAAGAWAKGCDYTRPMEPRDLKSDVWSGGTYDNNATITELRFLARVISIDPTAPLANPWRHSFGRGLDYVLASQYPNGGFPQIFPLAGSYHDAVTFNDDAVIHVLELLRDIANGEPEFHFVPQPQARHAQEALQRGIQCVLAAQIRTPSGRLLAWGQQHDALTLLPCAARNFEPVAVTAGESAGIVRFLMTSPDPGPEIVAAVDAAMAWFESMKFEDMSWDRQARTGTGMIAQPGAPDLWARLYELETARPVFGERDRVSHYAVTELSDERRLGYGWFSYRPATLRPLYAAWKSGVRRASD